MDITPQDGPNSSPVSTHFDPIIAAIASYREACETFEALDWSEVDNPASVEKTYGPPLSVLQSWTMPAETIDGAVAALRLAHEDLADVFLHDCMPLRMVSAALGFLETIEVGA